MSITDQEKISRQKRRSKGIKISFIAIFVNLCLFVAKLLVGFLFDSVSLKADAVNNLSDFASALVLLISFYISTRPADRKHPFGHARFEYIASAIVAMFIMLLGFELGKSSVLKFLDPKYLSVNWLFYGTLMFSVVVKFALFYFYTVQSKKLHSPLLLATARDSISDVIMSSGIVLAVIIGKFFAYPVDGLMGLLISIWIIISGFLILFKTSNRLLGEKADRHLRDHLKNFIRSQTGIYGVHDLIVHDYGVDNYYASAHVEVDAAEDVKASHDLIDHIEREIAVQFKVNMLLHMDPIDLNDPRKNQLERIVRELVTDLEEGLTVHDFRLVKARQSENLVFDLKVPDSSKLSNEELRERISSGLKERYPDLQSYITIDRNYEIDTVQVPF